LNRLADVKIGKRLIIAPQRHYAARRDDKRVGLNRASKIARTEPVS